MLSVAKGEHQRLLGELFEQRSPWNSGVNIMFVYLSDCSEALLAVLAAGA